METTLSFSQFADKVACLRRRPGMREGQHAFNALASERPDIANQIRGRYYVDPFDDDSLLSAFWAAVENLWGQ